MKFFSQDLHWGFVIYLQNFDPIFSYGDCFRLKLIYIWVKVAIPNIKRKAEVILRSTP